MKLKSTKRPPVAVPRKRVVREMAPVTLPEFQLQKIMVPIDFSDPSRKALHYAISFARQFKSEILLVHVAEPLVPVSPSLMGVVPSLESEPPEITAAKQLLDWRREIDPKIRAETSVRRGLPNHEIVQAAEDNHIDLIIISRRGRTGLAHLLLGGTAEYVLRHAPCPALVVRDHEHDFIEEPPAEESGFARHIRSD